MDERDILSRICARYPARLYLASVGGRSMHLRYGKMDEAMRTRLQTGLAPVPLGIQSDAEPAVLDVELEQGPCPGEEGEILWLRCGEQRFACPGDDYVDTAIWTLYCLARDRKELQGLSDVKLRTITYSASQQALAAKLLRSSDYWQQTLGAEVLPALLEEAVTRCVKNVAAMAPRFTDRPFTESGRKLLEETTCVFVKERQMKRGELAQELYGKTPFSRTLQTWMARMEHDAAFHDAAFQKAREKVQEQLTEKLFRLPMMEASVRLRDAVQELERSLDPKKELQKAEDALALQVTVKRVSQEFLESCFREADEHYQEAARRLIATAMLEPVARWLSERVEQKMPSALRTMQDWNRGLQGFCRIRSGDERLQTGWDCCSELQDSDLSVAQDGWTGDALRDLHTSSGIRDDFRGNYYLLLWACSPVVSQRWGEKITGIGERTVKVQGMSEQLVVALMRQSIQNEREA